MQKNLGEAKENLGSPAFVKLADKIESPLRKGTGSPRKPLTPLQRKLEKKVENGKEVKLPAEPIFADITPLGINSKNGDSVEDSGTSAGLSKASLKGHSKIMKKLEFGVPNETTDLDLITGDISPLEYWKQLAEQRRVALEETLKENQMLTEKIQILEEDNRNLEEMLEEAKTLAEMALSEANDSGIIADTTFNTSTI